MPKLALTDLALQKLEPGTYWDAKLPAFGVRIGKNTRTWIVMPTQRRVRKVIGHYPNMPLAKARATARSLLANRDTYEDIKFSEAVEQFLAVQKARTRPKTYYELKRLLERHFLPKLGNRNLADLKTGTVMGLVEALVDTPSEAVHAFVAGRQFFRWAAGRGYCQNLLQGQKPPAKGKRRTRVLTDEEICKLWSATGQFADYSKMLLLTGQRRGELRRAKFEADTFIIPADVAKNGRESVIPLLPMAAKFVRPYPNFAWSREKEKLDETTGLSDWTLHDLRRTFRTGLGKLKVPPHVAERLVNHVSSQSEVERVYDTYRYEDEMRSALEQWEAHIKNLLTANETRNGRHVSIEAAPMAA